MNTKTLEQVSVISILFLSTLASWLGAAKTPLRMHITWVLIKMLFDHRPSCCPPSLSLKSHTIPAWSICHLEERTARPWYVLLEHPTFGTGKASSVSPLHGPGQRQLQGMILPSAHCCEVRNHAVWSLATHLETYESEAPTFVFGMWRECSFPLPSQFHHAARGMYDTLS